MVSTFRVSTTSSVCERVQKLQPIFDQKLVHFAANLCRKPFRPSATRQTRFASRTRFLVLVQQACGALSSCQAPAQPLYLTELVVFRCKKVFSLFWTCMLPVEACLFSSTQAHSAQRYNSEVYRAYSVTVLGSLDNRTCPQKRFELTPTSAPSSVDWRKAPAAEGSRCRRVCTFQPRSPSSLLRSFCRAD